jgi:hypothetical protein
VDAAKAGQATVVEALHAERKAIHASGKVGLETIMLHRARIGFQSHFKAWCELQPRCAAIEDRADVRGIEQARRSPAEEHAGHRAAPDQRQILIEIGEQRGNVVALGQFALQPMRIEIAVRAFAHAPGNVDVERQRRQGKHGDIVAA